MKKSPGKQKLVKLEWPGAFKLIDQSRKQLRSNVWNLLTVFIGYLFVYLITGQLVNRYATVNKVIKLTQHQSANLSEIKNYPLFIFFAIIMILALNLFNLFTYFYGFRNAEAKSVELSEAFSSIKSTYFKFLWLTLAIIFSALINVFLLSAFISLISMISSLSFSILIALVIAFLETYLLIPRLVFVYCLTLEEKTGLIESIKKSWKISKPHLSKIQMYIIAWFCWGFLGLILGLIIIGIPATIYILMFTLTSPALLYKYVKSNQ